MKYYIMKKKYFTIGLVLSTLFIQCTQKEKSQDVSVLKAKIHASEDFKNYESSTQQLMESIADGEISFRGADREKAKWAAKNVKSLNELTKSFEDAGIQGAKKYAELLFLQHKSMLNIIKSNPELKMLSKAEMNEILKLNINPNLTVPNSNK